MSSPDPHRILTVDEVRAQAAPGFFLADGVLEARYLTRNFAAGLEIVNRIGAEAEKWDHHPDLELRYGDVVVRLHSHDDAAITHRDIRMSHLVAACAEALGVPAENTPYS